MADKNKKKQKGISSLLKPYAGMVILLLLFALISNGLNLMLPKIIGNGIDAFNTGHFSPKHFITLFSVAVFVIFVFAYLQNVIQTYVSERVARDLRTRLAYRISGQTYSWIEKSNPSRLLTNLTADVDSIKLFVSQAIVSIASSLFIIIGVTIL
ncbi:MAG: ABC transporter transmembrane domain-containing protein, partial [Segetibacter sp.]